MAVNFLHGVETIEVEIGGQTVNVVKSSVVAIIGIAPKGPTNVLTLCNNETDDANFGKTVPGFNIPKSLQIIRAIAKGSPILVVNVFDPNINTTPVTDETQQVINGALKLASCPIGAVSIKNADGTDATIAAGTDYTIDDFGNFVALSNNVVNGTTYKFTYKKLNDSSVTPTQLIGGVDVNGNRTGISLFDIAFNTYGFNPKVFISPNYSSLSAISSAFATAANKFRAIYLLDAGYGLSVQQAIAGRGVGGNLVFNTSDERAFLLYPYLKAYDDYAGTDQDYPYSAFMAGVIIATDLNFGYWYSPSNKLITAATGVERVIQWAINDQNCEANLLNAAGITTVAQGYGTGILSWGNRNASFPTSGSIKNFVATRRCDDMVIESLELAALPYIDSPLTQALIDTIREAGNQFMRTLIGRGAILSGSRVLYNPDDNPASQLASGRVVFERIYCTSTPAEGITYKSILDISLLNQFK